MKSTIVERRRARGLLVALGCMSVMAGFMACSGSATKRTTRGNNQYNSGGDAAQAAGAGGLPSTDQGGSASTVTAGSAGDAGSGGSAQAGESFGGAPGVSGAAGDAAGGATGGGTAEGGSGAEPSDGGAGGEGGQAPFVDPVCGVNLVQVGAYSLWCGKVNMHQTEQGTWTHDADCSSGCNVAGVGYCQKFYPTATSVVTVPQLETKDYKNAGCAESTPDGPGVDGEAACCAPAP